MDNKDQLVEMKNNVNFKNKTHRKMLPCPQSWLPHLKPKIF